MKVAIIYNKDSTGVINQFGMQNKEVYNPKTVKLVAESLEKEGHNVRIAEGNMYIIEKLHEFMPRVIEGERLGMVFNMAYGIQGESRYTHLPVIVKPKMEAVSYGIKMVINEENLRAAVKFVVTEFKQQALVEQFICGREFCVGLLGNGDPEAFPVLEIDLENDPDAIQTADDKRKKTRGKICPANISQKLAGEMVKLSKDAFSCT
jgi:D-alanine-D-alanine ligase